ncbi:hypothetical protein [Cellulomonas sp. Root137]|uniref:hypothetical protein n=1 Tax=Cellulomonas sp. Root137 TaxID=1736459 RepID=UPI0006F74A1F|nr:hypothetical protein [Cellulomonas sp. Root137]KQY47715.1 hypothetical protein ASD18_10585 [Cellulomonas sp. Root137]
MKTAYRVLAYLVATGVFVQAGAIAYAWFSAINELDGGAVIDSEWEGNLGHAMHGIVGTMVIPLLVIALLIVSFFAKFPGAVRYALIILGLLLLQIVLAFVAFGAPLVGALHGANALALLGVSITAAQRVPRATTTTGSSAPATAVA